MFKKNIYTFIFVILFYSNHIALAQDNAIEEIIVTGSYIKVTSKDGSSPVDIIAREEIDGLGAFLASDMAKYINGETIHVNGGMYMS